MRSCLFVPADSDRKLARGLASGADCLFIDLEDSVAAAAKAAARESACAFLTAARAAGAPALYVRVNALDTGLTDADLDAVMPGAPDGIVLPKAASGADVQQLGAKLAVREARLGLPDRSTRIIPIVTETAASLFALQSYAGASPRLAGLTWGAEDLSADLGAETYRLPDGGYTAPFALARTLTLLAAVAAGVAPIDTVFPPFRDTAGFRAECEAARREGFTGKMAIHPDQVPVINEVFTPSAEAIARARAIVAAFADGGTGVTSLDGEMLDQPHLVKAKRLLARVFSAAPNAQSSQGATATKMSHTRERRMPNVEDFRLELRSQLAMAEKRGASFIDVNSGELHRKVGGYPGPQHQMPSCCNAMYSEKRSGDVLVSAPKKGKGASVTIRYLLPR